MSTFDFSGLTTPPTETICAFELDTQHPAVVYAIVYRASILDGPGEWIVFAVDWHTGEYIETPVVCASPYQSIQEWRKLCGRKASLVNLLSRVYELQREQRAWVSEIAEAEQ